MSETELNELRDLLQRSPNVLAGVLGQIMTAGNPQQGVGPGVSITAANLLQPVLDQLEICRDEYTEWLELVVSYLQTVQAGAVDLQMKLKRLIDKPKAVKSEKYEKNKKGKAVA